MSKSAARRAGEPPENDSDFVESLARGLNVILAFARVERPPTIADLSRITVLSRAAVRRILLTLERLGYVASDGRTFRLQPKTLSLCQAYITSNPLTVHAQEVLDRIAEEVGETCSIGVLDEGFVTFVARSWGRRVVMGNLSLGARLPAFCTAVGRAILAHLPAAELDHYFKTTSFEGYPPSVETDEKTLRSFLQEDRELGYSMMHSEMREGLTNICVAIFDASGRVRAAIGLSAIRSRNTKEALRDKALPLLKEAARELSVRLSF